MGKQTVRSDGTEARAFFHLAHATSTFCIYVFIFVRDLKSYVVWGGGFFFQKAFSVIC